MQPCKKPRQAPVFRGGQLTPAEQIHFSLLEIFTEMQRLETMALTCTDIRQPSRGFCHSAAEGSSAAWVSDGLKGWFYKSYLALIRFTTPMFFVVLFSFDFFLF